MNLFTVDRTDYLAFNENVKPFQDVHVRRAISLAINRDALIKAVLFGNGKPANSILPAAGAVLHAAAPGLQYNLAAGQGRRWPSPASRTASPPRSWSPSGFSDEATIATILQSELKPLGINVKIQQLDPNTAHTELRRPQKYDMSLTYWTMDIPDPDELATFARRPERPAPSRSSPAITTRPSSRTRTRPSRPSTPRPPAALYNTVQPTWPRTRSWRFLYYSPYAYATTSQRARLLRHPLGNYHLENVWLSK